MKLDGKRKVLLTTGGVYFGAFLAFQVLPARWIGALWLAATLVLLVLGLWFVFTEAPEAW